MTSVLEAVATGCHDLDACWRPVATPAGLPLASPELAVAWVALFACLLLLIRGLGRG